MFKYTDKLYKQYALKMVRAFSSLNRELQALPFDELNASKGYKAVSERVKRTYQRLYDDLIEVLILIALWSFENNCETVIEKKGNKIKYYAGQKDGFRKTKTFDAEKYVTWYLSSVNYVTQYIFVNEFDRKLARTIEEIISSPNKSDINKNIEKALKYWNRQAKQAGDNITIESALEGAKSAGITKVIWVTQDDERVCPKCNEKDGKIFDIDKIMLPLHYNCRCYFKIITK
jgi:SPP1 gp7 family putative phage head morphogenesis protein